MFVPGLSVPPTVSLALLIFQFGGLNQEILTKGREAFIFIYYRGYKKGIKSFLPGKTESPIFWIFYLLFHEDFGIFLWFLHHGRKNG